MARRPRFSFVLFGVIAFIAQAVPAWAFELEEAIQSEGKAIADYFDVASTIKATAGDEYTSQEGVGVSIGLRKITADLDSASPDGRIFRLRWILGHELWHQVQLKLYPQRFPAKDAELSRLFECQADMMAALYTGTTIFKRGAPVSDLEMFTRSVNDTYQMAIELSNELVPQGGHPSEDERLMALNFGILRALSQRLHEQPPSPDNLYFPTLVDQLSENTADEDATPWSYRLCGKIVHLNADAVGAITLKNESPPWPKGATSGWYRLRYGNSSDRSIQVSLSVQLAQVKTDDGNDTAPSPIVSHPFVFELAPGANQLVTGFVSAPESYANKVALIYPRRAYAYFTLISAKYLDVRQAFSPISKIDASKLRPSAQLLFSLLPRLMDEASDKFTSLLSGVCEDRSDEKVCPVSVMLPGALDTHLYQKRTGEASISGYLYEGPSREEAIKVFTTFAEDLKSIYPTIRLPKIDPTSTKRMNIDVDITRHAGVYLLVLEPSKRVSDSNYTVLLEIQSLW